MRVLVTGGAGFIGSHICRRFLEVGHSVVCLDNFTLGKPENIQGLNGDFTFIECDCSDIESVKRVFEEHEISRIYHLAANSDIQKGGLNPVIDHRDTFSTTYAILEAARIYGIKELFFASTSAVYGERSGALSEDMGGLAPVSYYGASKLASEAFISAYSAMNDMSTLILRFPNVVGEGLTHGVIFDFVKKLRENPQKLTILGDGKQEKPYLYVGDLIKAIMDIPFPESGVEIYNAGVETATTVTRIGDIVCEEMGLSGVEYSYTGGRGGWKGDVPKFQYDLSKIHGAGWAASHSSDEAVRLAARSVYEK